MNLPPLPPYLNASYEGDNVFTADQMREYGEACRKQALEEAAQLMDQLYSKPPKTPYDHYVGGFKDALDIA